MVFLHKLVWHQLYFTIPYILGYILLGNNFSTFPLLSLCISLTNITASNAIFPYNAREAFRSVFKNITMFYSGSFFHSSFAHLKGLLCCASFVLLNSDHVHTRRKLDVNKTICAYKLNDCICVDFFFCPQKKLLSCLSSKYLLRKINPRNCWKLWSN